MNCYKVHHRPTKSQAYLHAESAQEACEDMGWLIGDCFIEIEGHPGDLRKQVEPTLRIETEYPDGYKVQYWHLVLPGTKRLPEKVFPLGPAARVCVHLLGIAPHALATLLEKRYGSADPGQRDVNFCLARMILDKSGGMRACRKLETWELAVQ